MPDAVFVNDVIVGALPSQTIVDLVVNRPDLSTLVRFFVHVS